MLEIRIIWQMQLKALWFTLNLCSECILMISEDLPTPINYCSFYWKASANCLWKKSHHLCKNLAKHFITAIQISFEIWLRDSFKKSDFYSLGVWLTTQQQIYNFVVKLFDSFVGHFAKKILTLPDLTCKSYVIPC